jgi:hypothetical protein
MIAGSFATSVVALTAFHESRRRETAETPTV